MPYALVGLSMLLVISLMINFLFIRQVYVGMERLARAEDDQTLTQSEVSYLEQLLHEAQQQEEEDYMRIAVDTESNRAYWIGEHGLMWTDVEDDGSHDISSGVMVDAHSLSEQEVIKLVNIIDALKDESYDEGSGSGE